MLRWLKCITRCCLIFLACLLILLGILYFQVPQYLAAYSGYGFANTLPPLETKRDTIASCHSEPINVVTYNVRYGSATIEKIRSYLGKYAPGDYLPWSERLPEINALISSYTPDLIGLQETDTDQDIAKIVALDKYTLRSYHLKKFEYGDAALLYKTARFDMLDSGQLWLGPNSQLPLSLGFRPLSVIRYVNWAVLHEKATGFTFLFVNTHFDNDMTNKVKSSELFYTQITRLTKKYPVVVVGDFNSRANTERYQHLIGATHSPADLTNTYDLQTSIDKQETAHPNDLIDHILVGGPCQTTVTNWQVDKRTMPNGMTLSDHNPVIATLQFTENHH